MTAERSRVECRSEWMYAERPVAFQWGGERLEVTRVERAWLSPSGRHFLVACAGVQRFELVYFEDQDSWQVTPA